MREQSWEFAAGTRVPRLLIGTVDCTAIFNWPAVIIEHDDKWVIAPTEPVRKGAPPFLLRPATERRRGAAVLTRDFLLTFEVKPRRYERHSPPATAMRSEK